MGHKSRQNRQTSRKQPKPPLKGSLQPKLSSLYAKDSFLHGYNTKICHGGELRKKRSGRGLRPLSPRQPLHLVFKARKVVLKSQSLRSAKNFAVVNQVLRQYAKRFHIRVDQFSIQHDHIHLLLRTHRRFLFQHFFRVVAGQIAQRLEQQDLLKKAPRVTGTSERGRGRKSVIGTAGAQIAGKKTVVTGTPKLTPGGESGGAVRSVKLGEVRTSLWVHRPFSRVVKGWRAFEIARNYVKLNELEVLGKIRYQPERLRGLSSADWEILRSFRG